MSLTARSKTAEMFRRLDRETAGLDRTVESFRDERMAAINRQLIAIDQYEEELKDIAALEDIDDELGRLEVEQHNVDHNIMRHLFMTLQSDSYGEGFEMEDDVAGGDSTEEKAYLDEQGLKPVRKGKAATVVEPPRREPPSSEVKEHMREAVFGYLDAARADEDELEMEYEQLKEGGGKAAELSAERWLITKKANATALLKMIKEYHPITSGNIWGNDPDFQSLIKRFDRQLI